MLADDEESVPTRFIEDSIGGKYVEAVYFMTTTITTVGYGSQNYKGFIGIEELWDSEMLYLSCVIFAGIVLFSTVTHEIFSYKHLRTLNEIVKERVDEMEVYLYDISRKNDT